MDGTDPILDDGTFWGDAVQGGKDETTFVLDGFAADADVDVVSAAEPCLLAQDPFFGVGMDAAAVDEFDAFDAFDGPGDIALGGSGCSGGGSAAATAESVQSCWTVPADSLVMLQSTTTTAATTTSPISQASAASTPASRSAVPTATVATVATGSSTRTPPPSAAAAHGRRSSRAVAAVVRLARALAAGSPEAATTTTLGGDATLGRVAADEVALEFSSPADRDAFVLREFTSSSCCAAAAAVRLGLESARAACAQVGVSLLLRVGTRITLRLRGEPHAGFDLATGRIADLDEAMDACWGAKRERQLACRREKRKRE
jgi:hypothetical protein